jgi:predicted GNAT superfamily acetyltransferase
MKVAQYSRSSFSWIPERLDNHSYRGMYLFSDTCNTKVWLSFGHGVALSPVDRLFYCTDLFCYQRLFLSVLMQAGQTISPIFHADRNHLNQYC